MDLSRPITYRTVDINTLGALTPGDPLDGYVINDVRFLPVDGIGFREKRSLMDGFDYGRVFLGRRQVQMRGTIYAPTKAALHDRIRMVRALFTPTLAYADDPVNKGFVALDFDWLTLDTADWPGGIIPVRLYARPEEAPGVFFPRDAAGRATADGSVDDQGFSEVWEAALECRDPRFYSQVETEVVTTTQDGGGGALVVVNKGDYPAPLQVSLTLLAANVGSRVMTLTIGGSTMVITLPAMSVTRTVRVDGALKVCTLYAQGIETLRMDLVRFPAGHTWAEVQPGANSYDWHTTNGGFNSGSRFWFRAAFA
jgi:hypothetical protein